MAKLEGRRFDAFDRPPSENMGSFGPRPVPQSGNLERDPDVDRPDKQAAKANELFH